MSKPKLLLADDSVTIQKVVNLTFADRGMDVLAFSDGDSAVENIDRIKPDIVLADVHMPGINGYQICELMRGDAANKEIPVVLLVGSFEPFDREEAERVGASAHLTKPFTSIAELITTVDDLLAASAPPAEPQPDTSDIDNLYQQSFVETVEIPQNGKTVGEYELSDLDDEMIQTSYAGSDPSSEVDETLYADVDISGHESDESDDREAESLIAESLPDEDENARPETSEDDDARSESSEDRGEDPFASVASEPPPLSVVKFSFDESDLLELPTAGRPASRVEYTVPGAETADAKEAVSLSPELIDLIVQKVVERLREEGSADRSAAGG